MDRGYRRYTERRAFVRRLRIVANAGYWRWIVDPDAARWRGISLDERWQHQYATHMWNMNEPGRWVHQNMTVPARRRESYLLREVTAGRLDPEGVNWPDNRKPHVYYW